MGRRISGTLRGTRASTVYWSLMSFTTSAVAARRFRKDFDSTLTSAILAEAEPSSGILSSSASSPHGADRLAYQDISASPGIGETTMPDTAANPAVGVSSSILVQEYVCSIAPTDKLPPELAPVLLGLFGEVGSLMTTAKKHVRDADSYAGYRRAVYEEFGDTFWYLSAICRRLEVDLEEILMAAGNGYGRVLSASDLGDAPLAYIAVPDASPDMNELLLRLGEAAAAMLDLRRGKDGHRHLLTAFADCYLRAIHAAGVSLAGVLRGNMAKARGRFLVADPLGLPVFDSRFPKDERLPATFRIEITQRPSGQSYLRWNGVFIGDPLTDNIRDPDGYRFHDVFHLAHAAILHWSPVFRALIKHKRKSDKAVDEAQDGGRALVIEEGLTAWIFAQAKELDYFAGMRKISFDLLKTVAEFVRGYEVEDCPLSLWESAILRGYDVFRQMRDNRGGLVIGDRVARTIEYVALTEGDAE